MKSFKIKKIIAMLLAVFTVVSLSGCSSNVEQMTSLLKGSIDSDVKGIISDQYIEETGWQVYDIVRERDEIRYDLAEILHIIYGVSGEPNRIIIEEIMPYYETLLQKFEYEIVESVENEDGSVLVTIKYRPFLLGVELDKVAFPFYEEMPEQGSMSYNGYVNIQDHTLFPLLYEVIEDFTENVVLGEEMTMDIKVYVTYNDSWSLSNIYYDEFLPSIIDLNLEE